MTPADRICERFKFALPEDYLRFWNAGIFGGDSTKPMRMSRFWWMTPDEIAAVDWPPYKIPGLVPFARTPSPDYYCWYTCNAFPAWVAECPRDCDAAEGIAPSFEGFIFRALVEEFSDSWQATRRRSGGPIDLRVLASEYTRRVDGLLRPSWVKILDGIAMGTPTLNRWKHLGLISCDEASRIIKSELAFPMLGKEFMQHDPSK
jgi:hypothetical protein